MSMQRMTVGELLAAYAAGRRDFSRANLSWANLSGADLSGANLRRASGVIDAGIDPRGYRFVGIMHSDGVRVAAGCRWFTIEEAKAHWSAAGNRDALARVALIEAWENHCE